MYKMSYQEKILSREQGLATDTLDKLPKPYLGFREDIIP